MNRFLSLIISACLLLSAVGCANETNDPSDRTAPPTTAPDVIIQSPTQPTEIPDGAQPMYGLITPLITESYVAEDGTQLFYRRYPNFQLILSDPATQAAISADLQARLNDFLNNTSAMQYDAANDYDPTQSWTPYFATVSYSPTRLDQQVLSLYSLHRSQTNEIHPTFATASVTYDLTTGNVLTLGQILIEGWSGEAVADKICEALSDRAESLSSDYQEVIFDRFARNASHSTAWYFSDEGLCFHFAPYDIAPYFMGVVTAEIPYSSLTGLLKPEYFPANTQPGSGGLKVEPYFDDSQERFSFLATMSADPEGTPVLLYPTEYVSDLSIEVCPEDSTSPRYTLFCADHIEKGQGMMIRADFSDPDQLLRISYYADGKQHTARLILDADNDAFQLIAE